MELNDEHEQKILQEEDSEKRQFKDKEEEPEDCDNDTSAVYSDKEQNSIDITHDSLQHLSSNKTKATNWSIEITEEYNMLQDIKKYLLENLSFITIRGYLEKSQPQKLQLMLKFVRPTIKSTINKLLQKCVDLSEEASVDVHAVTKAEHVKILLETINKKS